MGDMRRCDAGHVYDPAYYHRCPSCGIPELRASGAAPSAGSAPAPEPRAGATVALDEPTAPPTAPPAKPTAPPSTPAPQAPAFRAEPDPNATRIVGPTPTPPKAKPKPEPPAASPPPRRVPAGGGATQLIEDPLMGGFNDPRRRKREEAAAREREAEKPAATADAPAPADPKADDPTPRREAPAAKAESPETEAPTARSEAPPAEARAPQPEDSGARAPKPESRGAAPAPTQPRADTPSTQPPRTGPASQAPPPGDEPRTQGQDFARVPPPGSRPAAPEGATVAFWGDIPGAKVAPSAPAPARAGEPVVGWLVAIEGPEKGRDWSLFPEGNPIGRAEANRVRIEDPKIADEAPHAVLYYDPRAAQPTYYLQPGVQKMVYVNGNPIFAAAVLQANDIVSMGETKLLFVPLCTDRFRWQHAPGGGDAS